MEYPIAETFYSLIGEGKFTGEAAFFIRLAGCNFNCDFCDTNYQEKFKATPKDLYKEAIKHPARIVVITGGEPTIHELKPLTDFFGKDFKIHLETNGTNRPDSFRFDWIALSPKGWVDESLLRHASEVKFLCGIFNWKKMIEFCLPMVEGLAWLMPLASQLGLDKETTKMAVDYCLKNPKVKFCCQVHKVIGVR